MTKQPLTDAGLVKGWLEEKGWVVDRVEYRQRGGKSRDLFNGIDLLALAPGTIGVIGIQVTSRANHAAREKKLLGISALRLWVGCGNRLWVMSRKEHDVGTRSVDTWRITTLRPDGLWAPAAIWKTKVMDGRQ